jgi:HSP20 family protein
MALVRWDSSRELSSLQAEMNRLFQTFFDTPASGSGSGSGGNTGLRRWHPPMDLVETEDHFVLRADLPGVAEDDVKVELEDNVLTISGERRHEEEVKKGGFLRVERATGVFARTLTLPEGVDADAVEASFDKGVLEVRIPKPEQRKPRRVAISVGDQPATIEAEAASQASNN